MTLRSRPMGPGPIQSPSNFFLEMDTQGSLTHIAAIFKFGDVSGPRAKK